jgi:hypothetical protein
MLVFRGALSFLAARLLSFGVRRRETPMSDDGQHDVRRKPIMATENDDRTAWDRAWASMPHRRLLAPPKVAVSDSFVASFGKIVSVTISADPAAYSEKNWRQSEVCPVCGTTTAGKDRLAASLHPTFENGFSYGLGVWVHPSCFENCPDAEEPTPIPW